VHQTLCLPIQVLFSVFDAAFQKTCPAGYAVFVQVEKELRQDLQQLDKGLDDMDELIRTSRNIHQELNDAMHKGRDRLLEYNSCRPAVADEIKQRAEQEDKLSTVEEYMDVVFDCFGVEMEDHTDTSFIIRPGGHMISPFPGLPDDGMTITFHRDTALSNEDMQYLGWEHPLVLNGMDMVLSSEHGNVSMCSLEWEGLQAGTLLLESIYMLETPAVSGLQANRYLPPTTIRVLMQEQGSEYDKHLSFDEINQHLTRVPLDIARQVIEMKEDVIRKMINASETVAEKRAPQIMAQAHNNSEHNLKLEIERLQSLRKVNLNIRDEEIVFFENQRQKLRIVLESASIRFDALRVIIAT